MTFLKNLISLIPVMSKTNKMTPRQIAETVPVAQRKSVTIGKSPETPTRITITSRLKVETKEQLESLSKQMGLSQTQVMETIVGYFTNTSDEQIEKIKLEYQRMNLEKELSATKEKLKKIENRG